MSLTHQNGKVYGYVRVSTDKQSIGPEVQRKTIEEAVNRMGRVVDAWFQDAPNIGPDGTIDDSVSGKVFIEKRKAGRELCERMRKGDLVVVAKIDRAFRSLADCAACLDRWEKMGVCFHICDLAGQMDITTPIGKAMVQILAVFAELERKMISQRTREALALRKRQGHATGKYAGYGFRWEKRWDRERQKHLKIKVEDADERRVMREIVKWRLEGQSWDEIRRHIVYQLKLVTKDGKPWPLSRICRAFQAELILQSKENPITPK
jgi:DNA invertase Pin-like site-specific DNA recombinase